MLEELLKRVNKRQKTSSGIVLIAEQVILAMSVQGPFEILSDKIMLIQCNQIY